MTRVKTDTILSIPQRVVLVVLVLILLVLSALGLHAKLTSRTGLVLWDFYQPWRALRAMVRDGIDPYSEEVTRDEYWYMPGRPVVSQDSGLVLQLGYPLHVMVLIGPLVFLSVPWAQAAWLAVLELALFLTFLFAPRAVEWRPPGWLLAFVVVVSLGMYHTAWALFLGQVSIVVAALTVLAWWGLRTERWALAGVCLALSTVKPQAVFLFAPFILLWAVYRRHWRLLVSFAISLGLLVLMPMLWQSTWPLAWLKVMQQYTSFTVLPSAWLAAATAVLLLAWIVFCWWRAPQRDGAALDWALGMLLVTSMLVGPRVTYVGQLVLLLPLFFLFKQVNRPTIVIIVGLALLAGPWTLDLLLAPRLTTPEHLLWQHHVINPILPVGIAIALLALSPRAARREADELA